MLLRHRLALVALLLVALGGSLAVGIPGAQVGFDGRPTGQARFVGPDVLATGLTLVTAPKAESRTTRNGAKRTARSFLLAALSLVLGLLVVRRRRGADLAVAFDRPDVERTRATRAPPVLVLTAT